MREMSSTAYTMLDIVEQFMHPERHSESVCLPEDFTDLVGLYKMASAHKLDAVVYEMIRQDHKLAMPENAPLAMQWRQSTLRGVLFQVQRTEGFLQLYRKLCEAGIRPLVVKGMICRQLYAKPDIRISGDEDILIQPEDFAKCDEIMLAEGFGREEIDLTNLPYEIQYLHPQTGVYIEVHLSLFPEESGAYGHLNQEFTKVFDSRVSEIINGTEVWTLDPTLHLFYLICHSFKHFLHSGFGIRQVCDMIMMAEQKGTEINWKYIQNRLSELHMDLYWNGLVEIGIHHLGFSPEKAQYHLDLLKEKIGIKKPDYQHLLADLIDSGIYGDSSMERKHSSNMTLKAAESGKKNTAASMKGSLFPSYGYMKGQYPFLKRAPWLLPAAWYMRIVRYLTSRKKQPASEEGNSIEIGIGRVELLREYGIIK